MACAGEAPSSGALATGADGAQLLLLHSKAAQKAIALHLPADALGEGTAKVRCESLASVQGFHCLDIDHQMGVVMLPGHDSHMVSG